MCTFSIERGGQPADPSGPARLIVDGSPISYGTFAQAEEDRARHLCFDLFWAPHPTAYYARLAELPRTTGWYFDVRPDLPLTLIGSNVWEAVKGCYDAEAFPRHPSAPRTLPSYATLLAGAPPAATVIPGITLYFRVFHIGSMHHDRQTDFSWPPPLPLLQVGVSRDLNRDLCCIGRDFLRLGLLCWDNSSTFFFPLSSPPRVVAGRFPIASFPLRFPKQLT